MKPTVSPARPVQEKIDEMNKIPIAEIHDSISWKDGKLTVQLQIGHPAQDESIKGCFNTHLVEAVIELHKYYQDTMPSRHNALVITKLEEARHWLEARKLDREKRGVLQTDKK